MIQLDNQVFTNGSVNQTVLPSKTSDATWSDGEKRRFVASKESEAGTEATRNVEDVGVATKDGKLITDIYIYSLLKHYMGVSRTFDSEFLKISTS